MNSRKIRFLANRDVVEVSPSIAFVLRDIDLIMWKFCLDVSCLGRSIHLMSSPPYIRSSSIHHLLLEIGMFHKERYPWNMEGLCKFPDLLIFSYFFSMQSIYLYFIVLYPLYYSLLQVRISKRKYRSKHCIR